MQLLPQLAFPPRLGFLLLLQVQEEVFVWVAGACCCRVCFNFGLVQLLGATHCQICMAMCALELVVWVQGAAHKYLLLSNLEPIFPDNESCWGELSGWKRNLCVLWTLLVLLQCQMLMAVCAFGG